MQRSSGLRMRASRYGVNWPVRVRRVDEDGWHSGRVVNLSVTGVLVQTTRRCHIGERVEVEIEFLSQEDARTIVSGVGHVVREDRTAPGSAAIHFSVDGELAKRTANMF